MVYYVKKKKISTCYRQAVRGTRVELVGLGLQGSWYCSNTSLCWVT